MKSAIQFNSRNFGIKLIDLFMELNQSIKLSHFGIEDFWNWHERGATEG
jgi:hypothetical protein